MANHVAHVLDTMKRRVITAGKSSIAHSRSAECVNSRNGDAFFMQTHAGQDGKGAAEAMAGYPETGFCAEPFIDRAASLFPNAIECLMESAMATAAGHGNLVEIEIGKPLSNRGLPLRQRRHR